MSWDGRVDHNNSKHVIPIIVLQYNGQLECHYASKQPFCELGPWLRPAVEKVVDSHTTKQNLAMGDSLMIELAVTCRRLGNPTAPLARPSRSEKKARS